MSRLYSSDHIIRVLRRHRFLFVSQKGSHMKFRRPGSPTRTVIVPAKRKIIPVGTFRSILRQSGLTSKDFIKNK